MEKDLIDDQASLLDSSTSNPELHNERKGQRRSDCNEDEYDEEDDNLDDDDDDDDDDDGSLLMDVPLLEHAGQEVPVKKLEAPPDGMSWRETAIMECMDLALKSHDENHPQNFIWKSPLEEEDYADSSLKEWIPKALGIPAWAIDPWSDIPASKNNEE